jgi:hypothetical protein
VNERLSRGKRHAGPNRPLFLLTQRLRDEIWQNGERAPAFVDEWARSAPELFTEKVDQGYRLRGFGRQPRRLSGRKPRRIVLADGTSRSPRSVRGRIAERRPEYAPKKVNADGWAATWNGFQTLFPQITMVLCFLHRFLKIRDRCRIAHGLHRRVWDVYRAATAEEFQRLMNESQRWCATQTWTASEREMLKKL